MFLDELIDEVAVYSKLHPALRKAHHFKFAKPHPDHSGEKTKFVVMGMNPGETKQDWHVHPTALCEETWRYDFRKGNKIGANSIRWAKNIANICGTTDVVQTEAFFWSSKNVGAAFEEKFGAKPKSPTLRPHFDFCRTKNSELINKIDPKAVIAPGLGWRTFLADIYKLTELSTAYCKEKPNHRLMVEYVDKLKRPWVFTKHWSGARGFTNAQRDIISDRIQNF